MSVINRYGWPRVVELANGNSEVRCRCGWSRMVPAGGIQFTQSQRLAELHEAGHREPDAGGW